MTNWEKEIKKLDSIEVAPFELSREHIKELKKACATAKRKQKDFNFHLAGHLQEEYRLDPLPQNVARDLLTVTNHETFNYYKSKSIYLSKDCPYYMDRMWCNYQKKYEFNPIHTHAGLFSFVIFLKIPYDLKKEDNYFVKTKANKDQDLLASRFSFLNVHPVEAGGVRTTAIDVDKSFEGKGFMFKAKQQHMVYPFYTSDKYRSTVSGNINLYTG